MHYIIELNEDGTWRRVYEKPEPKSAQRVIYASRRGGKPLNIGINQAKRVAASADRRDQLAVLKTLGPGLPRQHENHQRLVLSRHRYYHDAHDEFIRSEPQKGVDHG
jgi:hypothetical protein